MDPKTRKRRHAQDLIVGPRAGGKSGCGCGVAVEKSMLPGRARDKLEAPRTSDALGSRILHIRVILHRVAGNLRAAVMIGRPGSWLNASQFLTSIELRQHTSGSPPRLTTSNTPHRLLQRRLFLSSNLNPV